MLPLSASRLDLFTRCPRAFKYRYLDGLEESFMSIDAVVGRVVHSVLEDLHAKLESGASPSLLETLDFLDGQWAGAQAGPQEVRVVRGPSRRSWWLGRASQVVERYYWGNHPFTRPPEERREWELTFDLAAGVPVRGFIDRLVLREDGVVEIHDYKTGRSKPPSNLEQNTQVAIYQLGVQAAFPGRPVESVWHYLARDATIRMSPPEEVLAEVRDRLLGVFADIGEEEEWAARPGRLCAWCGYRDHCPEGREAAS